jgi:putative ABC transport system permease protein
MVMAEGLRMTAIGAVIGLVLAVAVSRVMAAQLFQIEAVDPLVYGGVTLLLVTVAGLACGVPAIRAARTEPASALRGE